MKGRVRRAINVHLHPPPGIVPDLLSLFATGVSQPESESVPGYPADSCTDGHSVASYQNRWSVSSTLGTRLPYFFVRLLNFNCACGVADELVCQHVNRKYTGLALN